jgi:hypothetical protein
MALKLTSACSFPGSVIDSLRAYICDLHHKTTIWKPDSNLNLGGGPFWSHQRHWSFPIRKHSNLVCINISTIKQLTNCDRLGKCLAASCLVASKSLHSWNKSRNRDQRMRFLSRSATHRNHCDCCDRQKKEDVLNLHNVGKRRLTVHPPYPDLF